MVFARLVTYSKNVSESRMRTPRTKAVSCNADFKGSGFSHVELYFPSLMLH